MAIDPLLRRQIYIFLTTSCAAPSFSFLAREVLSPTPIDYPFALSLRENDRIRHLAATSPYPIRALVTIILLPLLYSFK